MLTSTRRRRYSAVVALAFLATGCTTLYEGKYDFWEGWREGVVQEVALGDRLTRGATKDCRKGVHPEIVRDTVFARVSYKISRTRVSVILPLRLGAQFAPGDSVYVNPRKCAGLAHRAPSSPE